MNPAPPETTALGLLPANAAIGESQVLHRGWVVDVAAIYDHRTAHQLFDASQVELPKLVPLCDQYERVGTCRDLVGVLPILDVGQEHPGSLHGGGVVSTQLGASREQNPRDVDARGVAHVIRVRLEREPKQADDPSGKLFERLAKQVDDQHALVTVDVHDCVQQLRVVVEALGYGGEGRHVLSKTTSTPSNPSIEVRRADAFVEAHAFGDELRVGADPLADPRDLVDERDPGGEECVRGVLDHFGGVDVWSHKDLGVERRVQPCDFLGCLAVVAADYDPIRVHEVLDRRTFTQKFGIRNDDRIVAAVVFLQHARDHVSGEGRHCGLVHDD